MTTSESILEGAAADRDTYQLGGNVILPCSSLASFGTDHVPLFPYKRDDFLWTMTNEGLQYYIQHTSSREKNTRGGSLLAC